MKKNIILYVAITLLACALTGTITYILVDKKDNKTEIKENNNDKTNNNEVDNDKGNNSNQNNKGEKITLSESELKEYLSYVPVSDYLNYNNLTKGAYDSKYIDITTINKNLLLANVIDKYEKSYNFENNSKITYNDSIMCDILECTNGATTQNYLPLAFINSKLKNMYNFELTNLKNAENSKDSLNIRGMCYYYENNNFVGCGGGSDLAITINLLDNYEATTQELIIYEYAAKSYLGFNGIGNVYALEDFQNNYTTDINDKDADLQQYLKQHKNKFTKYKHTFKKNNTGYYWYSSEVIN